MLNASFQLSTGQIHIIRQHGTGSSYVIILAERCRAAGTSDVEQKYTKDGQMFSPFSLQKKILQTLQSPSESFLHIFLHGWMFHDE